MRTLRTYPTLLVALLCVFCAIIPTVAVGQAGGNVLPPDAKPYGYTLDKMAKQMALFDSSGNMMQYYPSSPFEILFESAGQVSQTTCLDGNAGTQSTATLNFPAVAGTAFFVPVFYFDDSPPVLGVWPSDKSMAADYVFGAATFNAQGMEIIVDGKVTAVGAAFLGGPIQQNNPPLLDGGGTHLIQLGVFLTPMSVGTHTVEIKGEVGNSALFIAAAGAFLGDCLAEDITYKVRVFPAFATE